MTKKMLENYRTNLAILESTVDQTATLKAEVKAVQDFISKIPDKQLRYIFEQKFKHNRSSLSIALQLGYRDETVIRRKIKKFLEKAEKAEN